MSTFPSEHDYELAGWFLDGQTVELTAQQRALADEIAADERAMGPALDAPAAPDALRNALRRMGAAQELTRRARRARLVPRPSMARLWGPVAALAAAVVVAALVLPQLLTPERGPRPTPLGTEEFVRQFVQAPHGTLDAELEALGEDLAQCHMQVLLGDAPVDLHLRGLKQEMNNVLEPDEPGMELEAWEESL